MGHPRRKNKYGLTPQQEKFCQAYVDKIGLNETDYIVNAYRSAYNCSVAEDETCRRRGYELLEEGTPTARRIAMLEEQIEKEIIAKAVINREKEIGKCQEIEDLDPNIFYKTSKKTGLPTPKNVWEIPKRFRIYLHPMVVKGKIVWLPDKKIAMSRKDDLTGIKADKNLNINHNLNEFGDIIL